MDYMWCDCDVVIQLKGWIEDEELLLLLLLRTSFIDRFAVQTLNAEHTHTCNQLTTSFPYLFYLFIYLFCYYFFLQLNLLRRSSLLVSLYLSNLRGGCLLLWCWTNDLDWMSGCSVFGSILCWCYFFPHETCTEERRGWCKYI